MSQPFAFGAPVALLGQAQCCIAQPALLVLEIVAQFHAGERCLSVVVTSGSGEPDPRAWTMPTGVC